MKTKRLVSYVLAIVIIFSSIFNINIITYANGEDDNLYEEHEELINEQELELENDEIVFDEGEEEFDPEKGDPVTDETIIDIELKEELERNGGVTDKEIELGHAEAMDLNSEENKNELRYNVRITTYSLKQLRELFPSGSYWNYGNLHSTVGSKYACPAYRQGGQHSLSNCNTFHGASQCMGYAYLMGYKAFGKSLRESQRDSSFWTTYGRSSGKKLIINNGKPGQLRPGAYVRVDNDAHSVFITKVTNSHIYYTDCNMGSNSMEYQKKNCVIRQNVKESRESFQNRIFLICQPKYSASEGITTIMTGPLPKVQSVADVNGDGKVDLIGVGQKDGKKYPYAYIYVAYGDGTGFGNWKLAADR